MKKGILFFLSAMLFLGCSNQNCYKPKRHIVEIKDMKFQPENLNVHKGDTVIWINKDIVAHDVTQENKAWASTPIASDSSWKKVITRSDAYYCSIHVIMNGKLTVNE
ncbi:MAG: plastocyanin/azurin family copper-binding protein [Bacteroidia bacterium]